MLSFIAFAAVPAIIGSLYLLIRSPAECDMSEPAHRFFNSYFGIEKNYFDNINANDETPFFKEVIPNDLFSKSSFILLARRGGGKTTIMNNYIKSKKFPIELKNQQISKILNNFILNFKRVNKDYKLNDIRLIEQEWNNEHFLDTVIYLFVEKILDHYSKDSSIYKEAFQNMNADKKLHFSSILCIYSPETNQATLSSLLNDLWMNGKKIPEHNIFETKKEGPNVEKQAYLEIRKQRGKIFVVKEYDFNLDDRPIVLLFNILSEFKIPFARLQYDKLAVLTDFYRNNFQFTPTFIIDSLEEVAYFFNENKLNVKAIETFVVTSVQDFIFNRYYDGSIEIIYFFPLLKNVNIRNHIKRKDKIFVFTLEWTEHHVKNYADYLLKRMNEQKKKNKCIELPDFHKLVNYEENKEYIQKITTPRELNIFMQKLILKMNSASEKNKFVVGKEEVKEAFNEMMDDMEEQN